MAAAYWVLVSTTNYYILIASITVVGMGATISSSIYTIYVYELMTKDNYTTAIMARYIIEGLSSLFIPLYFNYLSNDSQWLLLFIFSMKFIGAILTQFLHESPRYLISTGQLKEAHEVFQKIARFNGFKSDFVVTLERI